MANIQASNSGGSNSAVSIQEYSIRVPKNGRKKFHVMRFNATLNVDFTKWTQVKMERENNMKEYKGIDEEQPKFGAGSEFGRESREEARRKKLGFISRSYKPDDQPWILKSGGKTGKKFKGIREGGVSENAAYYVFTHAADGIIEAFPLQEWYNFQPIQRYKALSAEEAEQEFGKRNRVLNYFSLMLRKRLKGDEELDTEEGGDDMKGRKGAAKKAKDLKISEMDEWMDSSSGEESSDEEKKEKKDDEDEAEDKKKKAKKANAKKTKKKNRDTDAEAFEDSDDGDDEGRELDYISSSSESEPEIEKQLQGVAEEKALRKLLTSDEDSEEEENKSENEESNDEENKAENKNGKDDKDAGDKKKKKKKDKKEGSKKKKEEKVKEKETSSDSTGDSTDSDADTKKKNKKDDKESSNPAKDGSKESNSAAGSRSGSPAVGVGNKRKSHSLESITKKIKLDTSGTSSSSYIAGSSESGITEDAVRRYLMRKPMTTTELLQKFKTKKTGLSSEQLVNIMTQILKKINPVKQTIKGKMYLSIKA